MQQNLATVACPERVRDLRGVAILRLIEVAPSHADVPAGWGAYNCVAQPVTLPDYLTDLATAFAAGLLAHDAP
jgi:hypothetical protein